MSLQIWLPLNGDLRNQGLSDLTFTGTSITYGAQGQLGKCCASAGSGYILSDSAIYLGKNQSVFCWIRPHAFNSDANLTGICGQHRYKCCAGLGITLKYASATTGYLCITAGDGDNRWYSHHPGSTLLTTDNWYHVGYTYDGTTVRLYVNGELDGSYNLDLTVNADYFQCFMWSLGASTDKSVYTSYGFNGRLNDVRAYNHTLSQKEIKELAKGLMVHYTFNNGTYEAVENIIAPPVITGANTNVPWDASLHLDAVKVDNWVDGYKNNVANPELGYHAYWKEINGIPTLVFPKLNYSVPGVNANRWMGVWTDKHDVSNGRLQQNSVYTVSFEAMADSEGTIVHGGHYYTRGDGTWGMWDGYFYAHDIPVGKWKRYTFTKTVIEPNPTNTVPSHQFWIYGYTGANGISYVRNLQVELVNTSHDYVEGVKEKETVVYDSSGTCYNANITGQLISKPYFPSSSSDNTISNASKNNYYTNFDGSSYVAYNNHMGIPANYTMAFWLNKTGGGHIVDWRAVSGEQGVQPAYINPSTNRLQYYSSAGGSAYFDYILADDTWYHIAFAVTPTNVTFYVDGVAQQTIAVTNPTDVQADLHIGCRASYTNIAKMNMRDFRIYSTTLNENDIKRLYNTPVVIDDEQNLYAIMFKEGDS